MRNKGKKISELTFISLPFRSLCSKMKDVVIRKNLKKKKKRKKKEERKSVLIRDVIRDKLF